MINKELFSLRLHENLCVKKIPGSGTTKFHQGSVSSNGISSCFRPILYFQKVSKHPYGVNVNILPCPF